MRSLLIRGGERGDRLGRSELGSGLCEVVDRSPVTRLDAAPLGLGETVRRDLEVREPVESLANGGQPLLELDRQGAEEALLERRRADDAEGILEEPSALGLVRGGTECGDESEALSTLERVLLGSLHQGHLVFRSERAEGVGERDRDRSLLDPRRDVGMEPARE
jgi:hypothetical protein